ncbi:xylulokinase [Quadrisphaera granulorum]
MKLVAGIDTSTQSCKVVIRDAATGALVREGRASHPDGTEVHPREWERALREALTQAGGLDDVVAVGVGGQQHGMVCLDSTGEVVRPALLWNDTRSAQAARDLVDELGAQAWADAVGVVPVASFTGSKLRWLADAEPENADRTAAVCLPHDWLTWRLAGGFGAVGLDGLFTDAGDASGTAYFSAQSGEYRRDLLELAFRGRSPLLPRVLGPAEAGGRLSAEWGNPEALLAPGTGDNAAAALGLAAREGDVVLSLGTSGVVGAVTETAVHDASGTIAGFADATGRHLPLVVTLNAAQVLDATAKLLGVDHAGLAELALAAPAGADGLVLVPYLQGERTPNRPEATGAMHGLRLSTMTPAHVARAAVEGLLCGLADGIAALEAQGVTVDRVLLVGGGARSAAVQQLAPSVLGRQVVVPQPGEYVADGAARQAAWVLSGADAPPEWSLAPAQVFDLDDDARAAGQRVRARYAEVRDLTDGA